jgi:hypothetical protein
MTDLDRKLLGFLESVDRERAAGFTLANVLIVQRQHGVQLGELASRQDVAEQRLDRHGREIRGLKKLADFDGEADTGAHQLEAIQREVDRQRAEHDAERKAKQEEVVWWKRQMVVWIVAAVGFVVIQVVTVVIAVMLSHRK